MGSSIMKPLNIKKNILKFKDHAKSFVIGIVLYENYLEAETMLFSNDKIKKGILPEDSFRFVSSISLMHNGNS